jgi:hypothetical protein
MNRRVMKCHCTLGRDSIRGWLHCALKFYIYAHAQHRPIRSPCIFIYNYNISGWTLTIETNNCRSMNAITAYWEGDRRELPLAAGRHHEPPTAMVGTLNSTHFFGGKRGGTKAALDDRQTNSSSSRFNERQTNSLKCRVFI